jgi:hypothetical protein
LLIVSYLLNNGVGPIVGSTTQGVALLNFGTTEDEVRWEQTASFAEKAKSEQRLNFQVPLIEKISATHSFLSSSPAQQQNHHGFILCCRRPSSSSRCCWFCHCSETGASRLVFSQTLFGIDCWIRTEIFGD